MPAAITIGEILIIFQILCDNNGSLLLDTVSPEHHAKRFKYGVRYLREAPVIYILRRHSYESDGMKFAWHVRPIISSCGRWGYSQEARAVLPNSLKIEIVVTMNLREWRHFLKLRCAPDAHPQMQQLARQILKLFRECTPVIMEDIMY